MKSNITQFPNGENSAGNFEVSSYSDALTVLRSKKAEINTELRRQKSSNASYNIAMDIMSKGIGVDKKQLSALMDAKAQQKQIELQALTFAEVALELMISLEKGDITPETMRDMFDANEEPER